MTGEKAPVARLMIRAFRHFETELLRRLQAQGIDDITYSNLNVIRHLDRTGLRLSELAHDAGMSKQAIGKIVSELERKGYVRLAPDPDDGRAKRIQYTRQGQRMVDTAIAIVAEMERIYIATLGETRYARLRKTLLDATQLFNSEDTPHDH